MNDVTNIEIRPEKVGWRVNEWCDAVGVKRTTTYRLMAEKRIRYAQLGPLRIITTSPAEFIASLANAGADQ